MFELGGFEFRDPLFLLVGLLAIPVIWLASRLPAAVTYSSLVLVDAAPPSLRSRLARLPAGLLGLAVLCLAIALAGPRTGEATTQVHREGIAIAMVYRDGDLEVTVCTGSVGDSYFVFPIFGDRDRINNFHGPLVGCPIV